MRILIGDVLRTLSRYASGRIALAPGVAIALLYAPALQAEDAAVALTDYWTVLLVEGSARQLAGANPWNEEAPLTAGDLIGPYQAIATDEASGVVLARGGDMIRVGAGTTIQLPPPQADGPETAIDQQDGDAVYAVEPRATPSFQVTTPHLIAGVKGTHFAVIEDAARLMVTQGRVGVETAAGCGSVDVAAGQHAVIRERCPTRIAVHAIGQSDIDQIESEITTMEDTAAASGEAGGSTGGDPGGSGGGAAGSAGSGGVGGAVGGAAAGVGGAIGGAVGGIGGAVGGIGGAIGGTVDGLGDTIGGAVGGIGGAVGGALGGDR